MPLRMGLLTRFLIVAALGYLEYVLSGQVKDHPEQTGEYAMAMIAVGVIMAVFLASAVVPMIGDFVGGALFSPKRQEEKDPHHDARAMVQRGEYAEAAAAYVKLHEENPHDTLAVSEAARLYCEK